MTKRSEPNQESLLVVSQYSGQLEVRDFSDTPEDDPSVSLIERDIHLQNVLSLLGQISLREGFQQAAGSAHRVRLLEQYGDSLDETVQGSTEKRGELYKQAKWEFARAYGLAPGSEAAEKKQASESFMAFRGHFAHQTNANRRFEFRKRLERQVKDMQLLETIKNREAGVRPHQASRKPAESKLPKLSTQDRLVALTVDPRAGFLPATHREKNQVMAFLDYLDNPEHPLGINNQFIEIFNHQEREKQKQDGAIPGGARSIESIVYELGDYLTQSMEQLKSLRDLEVLVGGCPNQRVTLHEEVGPEHPGYAPLVRFDDVSKLRDNGVLTDIKDPLRTREDRWAGGKQPGKHKTVEDQYTRANRSNAFTERISERTSQIKIGAARKLLSEAIVDQEKRQLFMEHRLHDALQVTYSKKYAPKWVHEAQTILHSLELDAVA